MTNKKVIKCIISTLFIIACLFLLNTTSQAASFSANISKTSVTVGDTFTVTVNANNATGMYSITNSNSNVSIISGSKSEFLENGSATVTFKAEKAGTVTITATAKDMTDSDDDTKKVIGSKTFTVTVKAKSSSNVGSSSGGDKTTTPSKPSFTNVNETVYAKSEVNVRSSYSTDSNILGTLKKGDSVTRTGTSSEWSKVTYNGQTAYISSSFLTTTKPEKEEEKKSNNKKLKSLTVSPSTLNPSFNAETTEYTMTVGSDVDSIKVNAVVEDEKAKVLISGNNDLSIGENTITVKVIAEDETVRTYKIVVTKEDKEQISLKELLVEGVPLQPEFNSNVYEYTLTLDKSDVSELNITATPNRDDAEIEIVGNTELKPGTNIVTILVKSSNDEEIATYQITVNVPEIAGATIENNKELYKYIGVGALGIILVIIIIVVIVKRRKNNDNYDTYYGMYNLNCEENEEDIEETEKSNDKKNISELPELDDEDLPKSLRKNKNEITQENDAEEADKNMKRNKKIDELYATDYEELDAKKRRGKHF